MKKPFRALSPFVSLLGLFSLANAHSSFAADTGAKKLEKAELILNWKAEPEFGGFYTARAKEFYAKAGVDLTVTEGGSGTPTTQMVASGKALFGISSADEVIIAQDRGMDIVAVYATYQNTPHGIMVRESRQVKSIKELFSQEGVLALQKGLPYAMYLLNKYPNPKVKLVPYLGGVGNFLADAKFAQQCFVTAEPIEAERKGAKPRTFLISDEGFNPYTNVIIVRSKTLKEKPDLVAKVVEASRLGWEDYLKSPEAANVEMQKLNPSMDLATFNLISNVQIPFVKTPETDQKGLGVMNEARWTTLSADLLKLKLIKKKKAAKEYFKTYPQS